MIEPNQPTWIPSRGIKLFAVACVIVGLFVLAMGGAVIAAAMIMWISMWIGSIPAAIACLAVSLTALGFLVQRWPRGH